MEEAFWLERWQTGQIGFHRTVINPLLQAHWSTLGISPTDRVFLPLCGKSLDMHWLREQGHPVLGVDIARTAVQAFFEEAGLQPKVGEHGALTAFEAAGYTLLCGDFFALSASDLASVRAVYDRAALIALPSEMRRAYAQALTERLPSRVSMLLITFEYDQTLTSGPPFAVHEAEVRDLYGGAFTVDLLTRETTTDVPPRFKELDPGALREAVYAIRRE